MMKCPKCKVQTLKEDYTKMIKTGEDYEGDDLYCPSCEFKESRKVLEDKCNHEEIDIEYDVGFNIDESGEERQHIEVCKTCKSWRFYTEHIGFDGVTDDFRGKWHDKEDR